MKIELDRNKVLFNNGSSIQEIHPFWLRERVDGEEYLDKGTQQRLFDPSSMSSEVIIEKAKINEGFLEIDFNDDHTAETGTYSGGGLGTAPNEGTGWTGADSVDGTLTSTITTLRADDATKVQVANPSFSTTTEVSA